MYRLQTAVIAIVLLMVCPFAKAQGTKADYDRAKGLEQLTRHKVFHDRVEPHWSADNKSFWYRNDDADGTQHFYKVDAVAGTRVVIDAKDLSAIAGDPSAIEPIARIHPSRTGGEESSINFVNRTKGTVQLEWIGTNGQPEQYGTIDAGQQHEQNTYIGHVWRVSDSTGKELAIFEARAGGGEAIIDPNAKPTTRPTARTRGPRRARPPRAPESPQSPDGKFIAFIDNNNVQLRDVKSDEVIKLTDDGRPSDSYTGDFSWSPDSTHLVALKTEDGDHRKVYLVQSSPPDQLQPKLLSYDYLKPGDRIPLTRPHLFDIASKKQVPISNDLFPNPWDLSDIRWEADSKRFTFLYNQRGHQVMRIIAVEAATGAASPIIDETTKTFIDYSGKFFVQYLPQTHEIIWMSERDGYNHLYLYDSATAKVKNRITNGPWVVRSVDRVDAATRQIYFQAGGLDPAQDPYYIHFCRINFDGSSLVDLTPGDGNHQIEYSPDNAYYIDSYSRVDMAAVNELRRSTDGKLMCPLETGDASELLATGWKFPERFVAKGRDNTTDIYGIIIRPTNFDPSKKYPVIEDIYAGPQDSFVPKSFQRSSYGQTLAELGFIVVHIDGMGTSNRSKAFHDVCWHNLGDAGFPDRILWMKAAAAKHPEMDITRVGVYGTSAGGQDALRAVEAFGDFYKAAVADCGCHDNRMDKIWWNEQWMGWPIGPWYAEQSNVTNAKDLHGALLLIVGETDHNVDPASTMQVVNALIKADKDFDLLVIPNADHGQDGPYGDRRRKDFFVRHLLGVEPRAN